VRPYYRVAAGFELHVSNWLGGVRAPRLVAELSRVDLIDALIDSDFILRKHHTEGTMYSQRIVQQSLRRRQFPVP
jgi:hypothetical protein